MVNGNIEQDKEAVFLCETGFLEILITENYVSSSAHDIYPINDKQSRKNKHISQTHLHISYVISQVASMPGFMVYSIFCVVSE